MKMIPTWTQFKRWQLPAKYTFLGFFVGTLLSGVSVYYAVRPNPDLVALNEALRSEKPTKLELSDAQKMRFVGEGDEIVVLSYKNKSNRPAYKVKAQLHAPRGPIAVPSDGAFESFSLGNTLALAESSTEILVARLADVRSALGVECIAGFSLSAGFGARTYGANGMTQLLPLMTNVSYETVFKEHSTVNAPIWAVVPESCG